MKILSESVSPNASNVLHNASFVAAKQMHRRIRRGPIKQQNAADRKMPFLPWKSYIYPIHMHSRYVNSRSLQTGDNKFYLLQRGSVHVENRFETKLEQNVSRALFRRVRYRKNCPSCA